MAGIFSSLIGRKEDDTDLFFEKWQISDRWTGVWFSSMIGRKVKG
jgi:hypothetical protein